MYQVAHRPICRMKRSLPADTSTGWMNSSFCKKPGKVKNFSPPPLLVQVRWDDPLVPLLNDPPKFAHSVLLIFKMLNLSCIK